MAIFYYTQSKKNPAPIYLRIREGTLIDAKARTLFQIDPARLIKGKVKQLKTPSGANANIKSDNKKENKLLMELERNLNGLKSEIGGCLNNRKEYEVINSDWLKEKVNPKNKSDVPTILSEYFNYYLEDKKTSLRHSTVKKLNAFKQRIVKYEKDNGIVYIKTVNKAFAKSLQKWCDKNKYAHNTKVKTLKVVVTLCNHAKEHGITVSNELEFVSKGLRYKKAPHINLTFEDLDKISNTKILNERIEIARDWLVISCYTAQRVSDFLKFTKDDVVTMEGMKFLDINQEKTESPVYIPLNEKVVRILDKRGGEFPPSFSKNVSSNETIYNELIKKVCRLASIDEVVSANMRNKQTNRYEILEVPKYKAVSSHIGRRSFATNYYGEINTALLISATGHSTEEQFLRYVDKPPKQNALSLAKEMRRLAMQEDKEPQLSIVVDKGNI